MSENQASPIVSPSPSNNYPAVIKPKSALEQMWFYLPRVLTFGFAIALFAGVESFSTVLLAVIGVYFALAAVLVVFIVSPQEVKSFKNLLQGVQPIHAFTQQVEHSTKWLDARFGPPCSWQAFKVSYLLALNYPLLLLTSAWLLSGDNEFFGGRLFYDVSFLSQRIGLGLCFLTLSATALYCFSSSVTNKTIQLFGFSLNRYLLGVLLLYFAFFIIIPITNLLNILLAPLLFIMVFNLITTVNSARDVASIAIALAGAGAGGVAGAVAGAVTSGADVIAVAAFAFTAVAFTFTAVVFADKTISSNVIIRNLYTVISIVVISVILFLLLYLFHVNKMKETSILSILPPQKINILLSYQGFTQLLSFLLFIFFPVFNALFDYCSWYFSRWLFTTSISYAQEQCYIKMLQFIMIDFTLAIVFLGGLLFCLPIMFDWAADIILADTNSDAVNRLNWRIILEDFRTDPLGKGFWVTGMLFSTLIPTALHLIAVLLAPFSYYYHDKLLPYVNAMQYQDSHKQWHINHAEKGAFILLFTAAIVFPQVAVVVALWLLWQWFSLEATVNLLADGCLWLHEWQYSDELAILMLVLCIAAPWLCDKLVKPFKDQFPQS